MRVKIARTIWVILCFFIVTLYGDTLYVAPGGSHTTPFNSWATAANDIQSAITAAQADDVIIIASDRYTLSEELLVNKRLTLRGDSESNKPIIDGDEMVRCLRATAEVTLENLIFVNGTGDDGGAISMSDGKLQRCRIADSIATRDGGGVYTTGSVIIDQCVIVANNTTRYGGGVYSTKSPDFQLLNSTVALNTSGSYGGGVYMAQTEGLEISNCNITNNAADNNGGGIAILSVAAVGDKRISEILFAHNTSEGSGGGFWMYNSDGLTTIADCVFSHNSAYNSGGGCNLQNPMVHVQWCHFVGNQQTPSIENAARGGGGINISGTRVGIIEHCIIEDNSTVYTGGGIYMSGQGTIVRNCLIRNNTCSGGTYGGGGVRMRYATTNILENCTVAGNYSTVGAGGVDMRSNTDKLLNCIVYSNTCGTASYNNYRYYNINPAITNCCMTPAVPAGSAANTLNVITDDLRFADADYRLRGGSPCIDFGVNDLSWMAEARDLDGFRRINPITGKVDLGCYEFYSRGTAIMVR